MIGHLSSWGPCLAFQVTVFSTFYSLQDEKTSPNKLKSTFIKIDSVIVCECVCVLYWEGCLLLFLKTETPQILGLRLCCVIDNSLVSYTIEYRRLISRFFFLVYIFRVNDKLPHFGSDHYQFISQLFECNDIPLRCIYDFLCFSTNL